MDRANTQRFLLFCGILAPIILMATIVVVGQMTPDYDPISDTISQMGTPERPYFAVLRNSYTIYGLLIAAAAYGLYRRVAFSTRAGIVAVLLVIHALFAMLLGVFPDTPDMQAKHFADDLMHNVVSAMSYLPLLLSMLVFRGIARQEETLKVVGTVGLVVVAVNLPMPAVAVFGPLKAISGLLQRLLFGISFSWLVLTFSLLYQKTLPVFSKHNSFARQHANQAQGKICLTKQSDFSDSKPWHPA